MKNNYISTASRWLFLFGLLISQALFAQITPVIQWQRVLPGVTNVRAVQTTNGDIITTNGPTVLNLSGTTGAEQWKTTLPNTYQYAIGVDLAALPDGGVVVLARDPYKWLLIRLSSSGTVQWMNPFRLITQPGEITQTRLTRVIHVSDGGYVVMGSTQFGRDGSSTNLYKFDASGSLTKSGGIGYAYSNAARPGSSGNGITPTADGGFLIVGVTNSGNPTEPAGKNAGWTAKLNSNLSAGWQYRYDQATNFTDVIPATDGQSYLVTGTTDAVLPSFAGILALDSNGQLIQSQRSDTQTGDTYQYIGNASIVSLPGSSPAQSVLFTTSSGSSARGNDFRLATPGLAISLGGSGVETASSFFAMPDGGFLLAGTTTSNDGDVIGLSGNTTSGWLVRLSPVKPLTLNAPNYDCSTGAIAFKTTGGDGSPITFSAPGIMRSSATSNTGVVEQGLRNDPKTILITAMQSGQMATYSFDLKAFCSGTTPTPTPPVTPTPPTTGRTLTLTQPTYNCVSGAITFNTTGGDSTAITYSAPGIMRSSATSNTGTVEQGLRNDPKIITITAMQSGQMATYSFDLKAFCNGTTPTTPTTHPDMQPLVDLYNATNGSSWKNKTNWLTGNSPCNWFGVSCNADGRVTGVNLGYNNLNGTLPASLGNLSELQRFIIFTEPLISGTLPASLGNLSKLQLLEIEYTQITGSIPESLGNLKQLTQLFLAQNRLSGTIPESLGNLSNLNILYLFGNDLTGSLPNSFATLPSIQTLHLYSNKLSGCIPAVYTALCGKDVKLTGNVALPGGGDFAAFCANPTQNCGPNKLLTLTQPKYDCSTGAITFNAVNGDGTPITYTAPGISRSSAASNTGIVEQGLRNDPKIITITAMQNGYSTSYNFDLKAFCSGNPPAPSSTLKLLAPVVDCSSRQVTLVTSGGDGSAITFNTPTITRSSATSPTGTIDFCVGSKPPVLQATQSGYTTTYEGFDFVKQCPASLGVKPLMATQISDINVPLGQYTRINLGDYFKTETNAINRYVPVFSFQLSGAPNGSAIDDQSSTVRSLQPYTFLNLNTFASGVYSITVTGKNECEPAATSTFRLIVNPASGSSPFTLVAPTYSCSTGAITFNYTGGNGSPVEFQAAGITGWTTNPNQFVDKDSRTANDVKPFTLMARQNGQLVTYTWDLKAACGRSARVAAAEAGQGLQLTVKGNPVGNTAIVDISGVEGQPVQLDLLNASGHVLEQRHIEQAGAVEEQRFELQRLPSGMLFLRAQSGQQHQTVKLIKQ